MAAVAGAAEAGPASFPVDPVPINGPMVGQAQGGLEIAAGMYQEAYRRNYPTMEDGQWGQDGMDGMDGYYAGPDAHAGMEVEVWQDQAFGEALRAEVARMDAAEASASRWQCEEVGEATIDPRLLQVQVQQV